MEMNRVAARLRRPLPRRWAMEQRMKPNERFVNVSLMKSVLLGLNESQEAYYDRFEIFCQWDINNNCTALNYLLFVVNTCIYPECLFFKLFNDGFVLH